MATWKLALALALLSITPATAVADHPEEGYDDSTYFAAVQNATQDAWAAVADDAYANGDAEGGVAAAVQAADDGANATAAYAAHAPGAWGRTVLTGAGNRLSDVAATVAQLTSVATDAWRCVYFTAGPC